MKKEKPLLRLDLKKYMQDFAKHRGSYGYRGFMLALISNEAVSLPITKGSLLADKLFRLCRFERDHETYEVLSKRIEYKINTLSHPNQKVQEKLEGISKRMEMGHLPQNMWPDDEYRWVRCGGSEDWSEYDMGRKWRLLWDYDKNIVPFLFADEGVEVILPAHSEPYKKLPYGFQRVEEKEDKFPLFFYLECGWKKNVFNLYVQEPPPAERCPNPKRFEHLLRDFDYTKFDMSDSTTIKEELRKDKMCEECINIYDSTHCFELGRVLRKYSVRYRIDRR